jgi:hypothetical protein
MRSWQPHGPVRRAAPRDQRRAPEPNQDERAERACFEKHGFRSVATYIQSGNGLFESSESPSTALTQRVEHMLATTFNYRVRVVLQTRKQLRRIVQQAPDGFGRSPSVIDTTSSS